MKSGKNTDGMRKQQALQKTKRKHLYSLLIHSDLIEISSMCGCSYFEVEVKRIWNTQYSIPFHFSNKHE